MKDATGVGFRLALSLALVLSSAALAGCVGTADDAKASDGAGAAQAEPAEKSGDGEEAAATDAEKKDAGEGEKAVLTRNCKEA